jgi:hypothetical protein
MTGVHGLANNMKMLTMTMTLCLRRLHIAPHMHCNNAVRLLPRTASSRDSNRKSVVARVMVVDAAGKSPSDTSWILFSASALTAPDCCEHKGFAYCSVAGLGSHSTFQSDIG